MMSYMTIDHYWSYIMSKHKQSILYNDYHTEYENDSNWVIIVKNLGFICGFQNQWDNQTPLDLKARSHSTPRLNHVQKVLKIWWTWSDVVILGSILAWRCFCTGMAVGGCSTTIALPKRSLSTANHVQQRVRLKIDSHVSPSRGY